MKDYSALKKQLKKLASGEADTAAVGAGVTEEGKDTNGSPE